QQQEQQEQQQQGQQQEQQQQEQQQEQQQRQQQGQNQSQLRNSGKTDAKKKKKTQHKNKDKEKDGNKDKNKDKDKRGNKGKQMQLLKKADTASQAIKQVRRWHDDNDDDKPNAHVLQRDNKKKANAMSKRKNELLGLVLKDICSTPYGSASLSKSKRDGSLVGTRKVGPQKRAFASISSPFHRDWSSASTVFGLTLTPTLSSSSVSAPPLPSPAAVSVASNMSHDSRAIASPMPSLYIPSCHFSPDPNAHSHLLPSAKRRKTVTATADEVEGSERRRRREWTIFMDIYIIIKKEVAQEFEDKSIMCRAKKKKKGVLICDPTVRFSLFLFPFFFFYWFVCPFVCFLFILFILFYYCCSNLTNVSYFKRKNKYKIKMKQTLGKKKRQNKNRTKKK
ncbi:hypothetical protein RFI_28233, partial [Reticulomyxa filosa]